MADLCRESINDQPFQEPVAAKDYADSNLGGTVLVGQEFENVMGALHGNSRPRSGQKFKELKPPEERGSCQAFNRNQANDLHDSLPIHPRHDHHDQSHPN